MPSEWPASFTWKSITDGPLLSVCIANRVSALGQSYLPNFPPSPWLFLWHVCIISATAFDSRHTRLLREGGLQNSDEGGGVVLTGKR